MEHLMMRGSSELPYVLEHINIGICILHFILSQGKPLSKYKIDVIYS